MSMQLLGAPMAIKSLPAAASLLRFGLLYNKFRNEATSSRSTLDMVVNQTVKFAERCGQAERIYKPLEDSCGREADSSCRDIDVASK